jgi:hypothetical protein
MPSDAEYPGTETEKLHYCNEHKCACDKCPTCNIHSYCPECKKCFESDCPSN